MEYLTHDNFLTPSLWVDQEDAATALQYKQQSCEISEQDASVVKNIIINGFALLDLEGSDHIIPNLLAEVENLWDEPPFDLSCAGPGNERPIPLLDGLKAFKRGPGVRLMDIHSHSASACQLYLNENLHRLSSLVLGGQAIATQTLFFEYGSGQPLHRDPWYVNHSPRSHLLAVWIALEDIHSDSGPLNYMPGSHKFPYFRFQTDDIVFHDPKVSPKERNLALRHMEQQIESSQLVPKAALLKRGQAFMWHGSLIHGGRKVLNPILTRHSLVIHFGRADTHCSRGSSMTHNDTTKTFYTEKKYTTGSGAIAWESPLAGLCADDFEIKKTVAVSDINDKFIDVQKNCTICGGSRFAPGPNGRASSSGMVPLCLACKSLEIQRIYWSFFHIM